MWASRGSNQISECPYTEGQRWEWDLAQSGLKQKHWFELNSLERWVKQKQFRFIWQHSFVKNKLCQEISSYSSTSFGPMADQKWPIPRCCSRWIAFPLATHEKQGGWSCKPCGWWNGTQVPSFLSLGGRCCIQSIAWKIDGYCSGTLFGPQKEFRGNLLAFVLHQGGFLDSAL